MISQIPQVLRESGGRLVAGLPARVVRDSGVSYAALGVYLVLTMMVDGTDPDGSELVGRGLSVDEVIDALAELQACGLVHRRAA
ncbi:MAG: hypothetical protein Q3979_03495 [Actinomycetaceae bacterium]|nr:hypothetical protein [Actinomycetaceae bacterium]